MDSVAAYRSAIKKILGDFASLVKRSSQAKDIDTVCLFDETTDNYMVCRVGWERNKRIQTVPLFVRIIDGKIWIEENWTEMEIARSLEAEGVSKDAIRLGFVHPQMRDEAASAVA